MSRYLSLLLTIAAMAIGGLMLATPAQAGKYSNPQAAMKHFIECANWLVHDPAKHAQFCDPGHDVFLSATTGSATPSERVKPPCEEPPPPCEHVPPPCIHLPPPCIHLPPPCHPCFPPPCHPKPPCENQQVPE